MVHCTSYHKQQADRLLEVTPGLIPLNDQGSLVQVELNNLSSDSVFVEPNVVIADVHQVTLEGSSPDLADDTFLQQFNLADLPSQVSPGDVSLLSTLLLEQKAVFARDQ